MASTIPTSYYGVPVPLVMKRPENLSEKIPSVIRYACYSLYRNTLYHNKGLMVEGIFRENGSVEQTNYVKKLFNDGEIEKHCTRNNCLSPFDIEDTHVASSALKLYLRELPDPIMKDENYDPILSTCRCKSCIIIVTLLAMKFAFDKNDQLAPVILKIIQVCIQQLSPSYQLILRVIMHLLYEANKFGAFSKMKSANLVRNSTITSY